MSILQNKKLVAISTDKATNPINLYGASKLAADKIFQAANFIYGKNSTKFSIVKYGNVINSRGSVIPYFKSLVKNNSKYIPLTDERMTRFFIKIEEGVKFVISILNNMQGGEIFIPKMPSIRIKDLAEVVAKNKVVKVVGKRPGEKIHEILITTEDSELTVEKSDRYIIFPKSKKIIKGNSPIILNTLVIIIIDG